MGAGEKSGGMEIPDYLTPKQAAPLAGMSIWQLYTRLKRGEGPPTKRRGRFIYFPRQQFIDWAAQDVIL